MYFLIILKTSVFEKLLSWTEKIFDDLFLRMLANVNILIEQINGQVFYYTYFPYQKTTCQSTKPFRVFRNFNCSLENSDVFPEKFKNIHGCTLRILTRNFLFGRKTHYFGGLPEAWDIEREILDTLKAKINFEVKFTRAIVYDRLEVWANGSAFGSYKLLKNGKADIMIGFYRHGPLQDLIFTTSVSYFRNWFVIAMLRPAPEFLKFSWLFAPFHPYVL
ncbi:uncharacterized protein LOC129913091 isoform X2 [Episyrphus balteatus]|uniref:uncharacterized protein LOC129913091 isoform X2 n=1 Tax=Episyrphus balteatus TaxID=286459 RepID=UPI0024859019|nr:uncharacterized protein LOC129913091 isoform X2 [Episyrphus balteatus]